MDLARQRRQEAGLADPRLAGDQREATRAGPGCLPGLAQTRERLGPSTERQPGADEACGEGRAGDQRLPEHLRDGDRLGETLQFERADRSGRDIEATERQHDVADQDLARGRHAAEPSGLDHRKPDEVVPSKADLADRDAHPRLRGPVTDRRQSVGRPLQLDAGGHGVTDAVEDGQDPVAHVLDHTAPGIGDRSRERGEHPDLIPVALLVPERDQAFGRADEVDDEHRRDSASLHDAAA